MGLISAIIESNRERDAEIARIRENTKQEIEKINHEYEERRKKLQEIYDETMNAFNNPNMSVEELIALVKANIKRSEAV